MKSAGKARNNGLYRHIRTSKEIIRNLLNDCIKILDDVQAVPPVQVRNKYDSTHAGIYHLLYRHRSRQKSFATHLALLKRMSILTHLL